MRNYLIEYGICVALNAVGICYVCSSCKWWWYNIVKALAILTENWASELSKIHSKYIKNIEIARLISRSRVKNFPHWPSESDENNRSSVNLFLERVPGRRKILDNICTNTLLLYITLNIYSIFNSVSCQNGSKFSDSGLLLYLPFGFKIQQSVLSLYMQYKSLHTYMNTKSELYFRSVVVSSYSSYL